MHPTDSHMLMSQKLALHLILKMNSCLDAFHGMYLLAFSFFSRETCLTKCRLAFVNFPRLLSLGEKMIIPFEKCDV